MALVQCRECGHEVSSEAKICPSCGVRLKPFSLPRWVKGLLLLAVPVFVIMGFGLVRYGSVTPCGMLVTVLNERMQQEGASLLASGLVESSVRGRSPLECARGVWNDLTESKEEENARVFDAYARSDLQRAMAAQRSHYIRHGYYALGKVSLGVDESPGVDLSVGSDGGGYAATAKSILSPSTFYVIDGTGRAADGQIRRAIESYGGAEPPRRDRP